MLKNDELHLYSIIYFRGKKMKYCCFIILLLISTIGFSKTPIVVVTEDLSPFNYLKNNEIKGSSTRLVKHILEQGNFDYNILVFPWARSYKLALTQPNVLIYTINHTQERHNKFHWILDIPILMEINFYALKSAELTDLTLDELKNLRIVALNDSVNDSFITRQGFTKISRVSQMKQSIGMLKKGRVDIIISSLHSLFRAIENSSCSMLQLDKIDIAFASKPAIAMSLKTPQDTVDKIKQAYSKIQRTENICVFMNITPAQCTLK